MSRVSSCSVLYSLRRCIRPFTLSPRGIAPAALAARLALAGLAAPLGGCAISTQLGPIFGASDDTVATGSITPRDRRFSTTMTDEDWSRAKLALGTALASEAPGAPAPWDNPASGLKGTVSPVASAYAADDRTCHAFVASLSDQASTHWYQGRACKTAETGWAIVETADWAPPGQG